MLLINFASIQLLFCTCSMDSASASASTVVAATAAIIHYSYNNEYITGTWTHCCHSNDRGLRNECESIVADITDCTVFCSAFDFDITQQPFLLCDEWNNSSQLCQTILQHAFHFVLHFHFDLFTIRFYYGSLQIRIDTVLWKSRTGWSKFHWPRTRLML